MLQDAFLRIGKDGCYRLVGAIVHHNLGDGCGHYTSFFLDREQKQWFHANDDNKTLLCFFMNFVVRYI